MSENKIIHTPLELFGIECGKGWYQLITPIIEYIDNYNSNLSEEEHINIIQIKEKWGTLQIYTNYHTDELFKMKSEAEKASWNTCETCGSKKYVGHTDSYISVCCIDCLKEQVGQRWFKKWTHHLTNKTYDITKGTINDVMDEVKKSEK